MSKLLLPSYKNRNWTQPIRGVQRERNRVTERTDGRRRWMMDPSAASADRSRWGGQAQLLRLFPSMVCRSKGRGEKKGRRFWNFPAKVILMQQAQVPGKSSPAHSCHDYGEIPFSFCTAQRARAQSAATRTFHDSAALIRFLQTGLCDCGTRITSQTGEQCFHTCHIPSSSGHSLIYKML